MPRDRWCKHLYSPTCRTDRYASLSHGSDLRKFTPCSPCKELHVAAVVQPCPQHQKASAGRVNNKAFTTEGQASCTPQTCMIFTRCYMQCLNLLTVHIFHALNLAPHANVHQACQCPGFTWPRRPRSMQYISSHPTVKPHKSRRIQLQ